MIKIGIVGMSEAAYIEMDTASLCPYYLADALAGTPDLACGEIDTNVGSCTDSLHYKWYPGSWPQWSITTSYSVGSQVSNDGEFYVCTQAHISTADDEPGTGVNWESYWDIVSACDDMEV
jgi:hypothetical protein